MKKALIVLACLIVAGCKGPTGDKGDTGAKGDSGSQGPMGIPGSVMQEFTGILSSGNSEVQIAGDLDPIETDDLISVFIETQSNSNVWVELGYPTGDNGTTDPYSTIGYDIGKVYFRNIQSETRYKILIVHPA